MMNVLLDLAAKHLQQAGPRWHVVHVAGGRRDAYAIEWLNQRKFEPYYPQIRVLRAVALRDVTPSQRHSRAKRLRREVLQPLFPRYVFVRFDPAQPGWYDILRVSGVRGIECEGNRPVPIADQLINDLRAAEVRGAIPGDLPAAEVFKIGQTVRIVAGPLSGVRGAVEKIATSTIEGLDVLTRITVAIEIFGRMTPAELDAAHIVAGSQT